MTDMNAMFLSYDAFTGSFCMTKKDHTRFENMSVNFVVVTGSVTVIGLLNDDQVIRDMIALRYGCQHMDRNFF